MALRRLQAIFYFQHEADSKLQILDSGDFPVPHRLARIC